MPATRIKLNMTMIDVILVMCEGNRGAMIACMEIIEKGALVDPDSAQGALEHFKQLDTLGIYGWRIYRLVYDVCGGNVGFAIALLRAHQLGQLEGLTKEKLDIAIDNYGEGIEVDTIVKAVQAKLPKFKPLAAVE